VLKAAWTEQDDAFDFDEIQNEGSYSRNGMLSRAATRSRIELGVNDEQAPYSSASTNLRIRHKRGRSFEQSG